jgi:hypothetical protein
MQHTYSWYIMLHTCSWYIMLHTCSWYIMLHTCSRYIMLCTCSRYIMLHICSRFIMLHTCSRYKLLHTCSWYMPPYSSTFTNLTFSISCIEYANCTACVKHSHQYNKKGYLRYLAFILILRSSDTQLNPGPPSSPRHIDDFPCGVCKDQCDWNQNSIRCDDCETWFHTTCIGLNERYFSHILNLIACHSHASHVGYLFSQQVYLSQYL